MEGRAFLKFFNSAAHLSGASLIATLCSALTMLIVPRYLPLSSLGDFAIFTSIYSLGTFCLNLGIPLLIVRVETDSEARDLFSTGIGILRQNTFRLVPASMLASWFVFDLALGPREIFLALLIEAAVLLGGLYQLLQFWGLRQGNSTAVSQATLLAAVVQAFFAVLFVISMRDILGMMIGVVLGLLASCLLLLKIGPQRSRDYRSVLTIISVHSEYYRYAVPQTFIDECGRLAYFATLRAFFAEHVLGAFFLADRVLRVPTSIAGASCAQALLASARSDAYLRNRTRFVDTIVLFLLTASLTMFLPLALWGPQLFSLVFGAHVGSAGILAQVFAGYFMMRTISSALSPIVAIDGRFKRMFHLGLGYHVTMIGGVGLTGMLFRDPLDGLFVHATAGALFLCYVAVWLRRGIE